MTIASS